MSAAHEKAREEMPISRIIADGYGGEFGQGRRCRVARVTLQDGLDIVRWQSTFEQPMDMPLHDDSERIHFSFTNMLKGNAACSFHDGRRLRRYAVSEGSGSISFGRYRYGLYHQYGEIDNLTRMISPEVLVQRDLEIDPVLRKALACDHCFLDGHRSVEMSATAHMLGNAMGRDPSTSAVRPCSSLWVYGQSLTLVSLFLEARREVGCTCRVSHFDRQRLVRARERLLEDWARPRAFRSWPGRLE